MPKIWLYRVCHGISNSYVVLRQDMLNEVFWFDGRLHYPSIYSCRKNGHQKVDDTVISTFFQFPSLRKDKLTWQNIYKLNDPTCNVLSYLIFSMTWTTITGTNESERSVRSRFHWVRVLERAKNALLFFPTAAADIQEDTFSVEKGLRERPEWPLIGTSRATCRHKAQQHVILYLRT